MKGRRGRKPKREIQTETQTIIITPSPNNPTGIPIKKQKPIYKKQPIKPELLPCKEILNTLKKLPEANPFLTPVDPILQNLPDYFIVIKEPMDFSTVTKKFQNGNYECVEEFVYDVKLIFFNAMKYNPPRNTIHIFANTLLRYFDDKMNEIYKNSRKIIVKFNKDEYEYWNDKREWIDFKHSINELKEEKGLMVIDLENEIVPLSFDEKIELKSKLEDVGGEKQKLILDYLKIETEGDVEIDLDQLTDVQLIELNKILSNKKVSEN